MTASYRIAPSLMFNNRDPWLKLLGGQNMLFIIVGHHTGHFASMTPDTLLSIGKNKTVHSYPFARLLQTGGLFFMGVCYYLVISALAMVICPV